MENSLTGFLIWCAGTDENVLKDCPKIEEIKQVGIGTLVCIPAVLAFFSMTYAVSTFVDNPFIYFSCGIIWSMMVFSFDRYIIASLRRTTAADTTRSAWAEVLSPKFIVRIIFSFALGIAVAHPITLRYFSKTINEKLATDLRNKQSAVDEKYAGQKDYLEQQRRQLDSLDIKHENAAAAIRASEVEEIQGRLYDGKKGHGPATDKMEENERKDSIEYVAAKQELPGKQRELSQQQYLLDSAIAAEKHQIESHTDYLAQVMALEDIMAAHPEAKKCYIFIVIFFIFVDILPVTFKTLTPPGAYEKKLDKVETDYVEKKVVYYHMLYGRNDLIMFNADDKFEQWKHNPNREISDLDKYSYGYSPVYDNPVVVMPNGNARPKMSSEAATITVHDPKPGFSLKPFFESVMTSMGELITNVKPVKQDNADDRINLSRIVKYTPGAAAIVIFSFFVAMHPEYNKYRNYAIGFSSFVTAIILNIPTNKK